MPELLPTETTSIYTQKENIEKPKRIKLIFEGHCHALAEQGFMVNDTDYTENAFQIPYINSSLRGDAHRQQPGKGQQGNP
jgi:hypothetical protein